MSYGKMNTPISLIQTTQTIDADGFTQTHEETLATVRAYKEDRHGTKLWANRAAFTTATTLFRFRTIPAVTVPYTLLYIACQGVRYRVLSAENVRGRGMYIECLCDILEATIGLPQSRETLWEKEEHRNE